METDSDEELHAIDWDEPEPFFDYTNAWLLQPLIDATENNDVEKMKLLLAYGKSVNINDNKGNTPLHVAVIKEKKDAFNFLLNVDEIRLQPKNHDGATPLALALLASDDYFAVKLIKKGVDVNLGLVEAGFTPLHAAMYRNRTALALCLIENGANINATSFFGETPLMLACTNGFDELVCMLLYYGADVSIRASTGIIAFESYLEYHYLGNQIEEVDYALLETTFDDEATVSLNILRKAMVFRSPGFPRLLKKTKRVQYNSKYLWFFINDIGQFPSEYFELFITKFRPVVNEVVTRYCTLTSLLVTQTVNCHKILTILCEHGFGSTLVNNFSSSVAVIAKLLRRSSVLTPLWKLEGTIACLLSYGLPIQTKDFYIVYREGGYSSLFKLMLHVNHRFTTDWNRYENSIKMCLMIVDYNASFKNTSYSFGPVQASSMRELLTYSSAPKLKAACLSLNDDLLNKTVEALPRVPSLLELARDSFRESLATHCNLAQLKELIRYPLDINCNQFYTIIENLPIPDTCKRVLTYERKLYEFN